MAKSNASDTKVTRISASDSSRKKTTTKSKPVAKAATKKKTVTAQVVDITGKKSFVSSFFGYFIGAWRELKQVHWPTRKATWGLTLAVLAFTAFFVIFILLLDIVFKYLFEQLLK